MEEQKTKERLLDVAEKLFFEKGIGATSLRSIIAAAGTNLASVHYHFGSKDALIKAVFERKIKPVVEEKTKNLELLEYRNIPPSLEEILSGFLKPMLVFRLGKHKSKFPMKMFSKIQAESEELRMAVLRNFEETDTRYIKLFKNALPHLPENELFWRFRFMVGAVFMSGNPLPDFEIFKKYSGQKPDVDVIMKQLIPFIAAGMRAPGSKTEKTEK